MNSTFNAQLSTESIGGGERVRTDDPLRARQVLSQLSYTPNETPARMEMVGLAGLEPATSRLSVVCSSQLSYKPIIGLAFFRLAALASSRHAQRTVGYASRAAPRLPGHPQKSETLRTNQNQTLCGDFR